MMSTRAAAAAAAMPASTRCDGGFFFRRSITEVTVRGTRHPVIAPAAYAWRGSGRAAPPATRRRSAPHRPMCATPAESTIDVQTRTTFTEDGHGTRHIDHGGHELARRGGRD